MRGAGEERGTCRAWGRRRIAEESPEECLSRKRSLCFLSKGQSNRGSALGMSLPCRLLCGHDRPPFFPSLSATISSSATFTLPPPLPFSPTPSSSLSGAACQIRRCCTRRPGEGGNAGQTGHCGPVCRSNHNTRWVIFFLFLEQASTYAPSHPPQECGEQIALS